MFFGLVVLSYVEGASLHQERGGATIIARYAFNELLSFIAGWAILLDYILLIAITAFATTDYAAVLFDPVAGGLSEFLFGSAVVAGVAWLNIRGAGSKRYERFAFVVLADLVLQTADRGPRAGARCSTRTRSRTRRASPARRRPPTSSSRSR